MPLHYKSGEELQKGDRVLSHGIPGHIELVADPFVVDPETSWYVQEFGGGVMILDSIAGSYFCDDPYESDDLEFVSRGE